MPDLPRGTVTFLFADVVVDSALWRTQPGEVAQALGDIQAGLRAP